MQTSRTRRGKLSVTRKAHGGNNLHELVRASEGQFPKNWPINMLDKRALFKINKLGNPTACLQPVTFWGPLLIFGIAAGP